MKINFEKFRKLQKQDTNNHNFYGSESLALYYYQMSLDENETLFKNEQYKILELARGFTADNIFKTEFILERNYKEGEHAKQPDYMKLIIKPEGISISLSGKKTKTVTREKTEMFVEATTRIMNSVYEYLSEHGCLIIANEENIESDEAETEDANIVLI